MATMDFTTKPLMLIGLLLGMERCMHDGVFSADSEVTRVDLTCDVRYIELHLGPTVAGVP
jgi:hypothetical protein